MERPKFINNEIYHIYNRGVEKRDVFLDDNDYFRFINSLLEFNDTNPVLPSNIRYAIRHPSRAKINQIAPRLDVQHLSGELLIEILAFCLMPNHFHLLVRQVKDNGISRFMQKVGTGYTNYFNLKNDRVGSLFQGRFKAAHVDQEGYFQYLPTYIHLNPLDLAFSEWRTKQITNSQEATKFLLNYRWSSYLDYIGNHNFPLVTERKFLLDVLNGSHGIQAHTKEFLESMDLSSIKDIVLEQ